MAGYRPAAMVRTPWGDTDSLRERKLRPGQRLPRGGGRAQPARAAVRGDGRGRRREGLRGDPRRRPARALRRLAQRLLRPLRATSRSACWPRSTPSSRRRSRSSPRPSDAPRRRSARAAGLRRLRRADGRPAGGVADVLGRDLRRRARGGGRDRPGHGRLRRFVAATLEQIPGREGMPPEIVRAMVGGLHKVIHKRLYRDEEAELVELVPQMWDWVALLPAAARAAAPAAQPPPPGRRPAPTATTRPSGSCGRSPRSSPRRATRR